MGAESMALDYLEDEFGVYLDGLFELPVVAVLEFGLLLLLIPPVVLVFRAWMRTRRPLVERLSQRD
jgi:uncharacterized membrane protein